MQDPIDQLAKSLASQTSRRGVLRALGAGIAAALFGRPLLEERGASALPLPACPNCLNGCCIGTTFCLPVSQQSTTLCGTNGGNCTACPSGGTCTSIAPVSASPRRPRRRRRHCGPGNCCGGCCLSSGPGAPATCVPPSSQNAGACGSNGATCTACPQGATCLNNTCITYNNGTCPNGCCGGSTCIPYTSASTLYTCGTAGLPLADRATSPGRAA